MYNKSTIDRNFDRVTASRCAGIPMAALGAVAVFALSLAAPVTIDADSGLITLKVAEAGKGDKGGDGKGGDGKGGDGKGGGGNAGNDNANDGNAGGNDQSTGNATASSDPDRDRKLLRPPTEPTVTLAQFTTKISKRYPANSVTNLENPHQAISFFSELQDMSGQKVTHRWSHSGNVVFNISFQVRSERWRIWSTQLLPEDMPGDWEVEIVTENGKVLEVHTLNFAPKGAVLAEN